MLLRKHSVHSAYLQLASSCLSVSFGPQKKIDKRGRKLVDFDSQRHNFQSLQCNPKKRDELKVSRGKELLEEAKRTYEQLNSELHDELPALYDSRVLFLVTNLQTLFAAEQVFHTESAKVRAPRALYCS